MVYHDASREGVISCWPRDAELPLRQPITPARSCGTMMMPKRAQITMTTRTPRHHHHAAARIRPKHPHPKRRYPYPDVVTLNARQQVLSRDKA